MSKTSNVIETEVRFTLRKSLIRFKIYHNLPETSGMNIEGAIDNWTARTKVFTAQSLCDYILSKDIDGIFAITERTYNQLKKNGKIHST